MAALVVVQGRISLAAPAAAGWSAMVAACRKATGVQLRITAPYGGHRTLAQQWAMWRDRSTSTNGKVAFPGTSVHGSGLCVDVNNWGAAAAWLVKNAARFGFRRTIAGEPWHFQHDGKRRGGGSSTSTPTPPTPIDEEDEMSKHILLQHDNADGTSQYAHVSPDLKTFVSIWRTATAEYLLKDGGVISVNVRADEWNAYRASAGLPPEKLTTKPR